MGPSLRGGGKGGGVRGEGGGGQEPVGIRDPSFVLSDPDTWGQRGLNGLRLTDYLGRGRTQRSTPMRARAN